MPRRSKPRPEKPPKGKVTRLSPRIRTYAGKRLPDGPAIGISVSMADVMTLLRRRLNAAPPALLTEGRTMEHWQDAHGQPKALGEVWLLRKGQRTARCILLGHPFGTEARVLVDDDVMSTKVFRDPKAMVDETADWRMAYEAKGWQPSRGAGKE